jgi:hypothetical protein
MKVHTGSEQPQNAWRKHFGVYNVGGPTIIRRITQIDDAIFGTKKKVNLKSLLLNQPSLNISS